MAHPYRLQLSNSLGDNINVVPQERISPDIADKTFRIKPHQILADQLVNTNHKKSHPFLKNLPPDVSKSLESLHLSSAPSTPKYNKSFEESFPNSKDSSSSSSGSVLGLGLGSNNSFSHDAITGSISTNQVRDNNNTNKSEKSLRNTNKTQIQTQTQTHANNNNGIRQMLNNDVTINQSSFKDPSFVSNFPNTVNRLELNLSKASLDPSLPEGTLRSPIENYFEGVVHNTMNNSDKSFFQSIPKEQKTCEIHENAKNKLISDQDPEIFYKHQKTKSTANIIHPVLQQMSDSNDTTIDSSPVSVSTTSTEISSNVNHLPLESSIEMYRQNAKKTKDPEVLFGFSQILIKTALMRKNNPLSQNEKDKYIEEAYVALKKASKAGMIEAQYYLGDAFSVGLFTKGKPDLSKSLTYFESAGKSRHPESAYRTAMCYKKGWGCTRDARKVVKYLEIAALNNHPVAMMEYGIYAFHGLMSFPEDMNTKKKGISWLRRATECATELSCGAPYELALIYINGFKDIVIKDTTYAIKLLFKAANLGHAKSASMLGKFYELGDIVDQNADLSIHFYNLSANLGDVDGMMGLCSWYFVGSENLPQDYDEAFAWALRAAENHKHVKAMLLLERFYTMSIGCEKNVEKAKYWGDQARSLTEKKK